MFNYGMFHVKTLSAYVTKQEKTYNFVSLPNNINCSKKNFEFACTRLLSLIGCPACGNVRHGGLFFIN